MRRSDVLKERRPSIDWRNWLLLAWATWFGLLYARMIVTARLPGLAKLIERVVGG
ncbi:MAG TPA: hypothetical protein VG406_04845 [Isosphaeraceae bacterium]|jgi:hypothetical protein|nr:hypothetical protein [Isosphaeraceae bacterium]